jgi:hypothetical protein
MRPREEILTIVVGTHDYGEPRIVIIRPLMISFLEDDSRLIIDAAKGMLCFACPLPSSAFTTNFSAFVNVRQKTGRSPGWKHRTSFTSAAIIGLIVGHLFLSGARFWHGMGAPITVIRLSNAKIRMFVG